VDEEEVRQARSPMIAARLARSRKRRLRNAADRNYLASLKCLALIRKAAPEVTVTINKTVNVNRKADRHGFWGGLPLQPHHVASWECHFLLNIRPATGPGRDRVGPG
jgi:hypothetical protein